MEKINKDWIIVIIILILINYFLIAVEGGFNMANWSIYTKLNFQAYCVFDMVAGFFYYLTKKV